MLGKTNFGRRTNFVETMQKRIYMQGYNKNCQINGDLWSSTEIDLLFKSYEVNCWVEKANFEYK